MTTGAGLLVLGSGSLAGAVCGSIAVLASGPRDVVVAARNPQALQNVVTVGAARAALAGRPVTFRAVTADLDADADLEDLFARHRPAVVLLCASLQSPWEGTHTPSAWTALTARVGFGLTLPLQAALALRAGRVAARHGATLVNACFPDAVNPVLRAAGVPVLCGLGNVAILAAGLQAHLGLPGQTSLAVLAHHVHLHTPADDTAEARAWVDGRPLDDVTGALRELRAVQRKELNQVTGLTGAQLLDALLAGAPLDTHVPGPHGLPGGYPVRLGDGQVTLRLPVGLSRADAVAAQQRWALADGVVVHDDRIRFAAGAAAALGTPGVAVGDLDALLDELLALRARLRTEPVAAAPVPV